VYPNPPNPGNLLIAPVLETGGTGTITIPNFTSIALINPGGIATQRFEIFYCVSAPGQTDTITATDTGSPSSSQMGITEFSGVTSTQDAALVSGNSGLSGVTSFATGNITTTTPNCLLIAVWATATATAQGSTSVDSGFTILAKANKFAIAYKLVDTAGTYGATFSWATSGRATAAIMAFQADPTSSAGGFMRFMG
jgi:hypothetical protein